MQRLLLLCALLGGVAAGRILQRDMNTVGQRIERMSSQDLLRQKFLLDIVQRVQQPLQLQELIQLDQGLITDAQRYRGGIDTEMQRVIELDRQRALLGINDNCNIGNMLHVQQLRGIYRLLVRALDFDTLQRNVIYLRRNINPVLLINALTMAIRDRDDTQSLIMPAMQEILPELYLDQQVIERAQRLQLDTEQSVRPGIMDLVGLGQRMRQVNPIMNIVMPWRDLRMQMALRKQQLLPQLNRVIVPTQSVEEEQIGLLTEDIGLRSFIQTLIQELAVHVDNSEQRRRTIGNVRDINMEQRLVDVDDMDNDRLMRLNRRRMQQQQNIDDDITDQRRRTIGNVRDVDVDDMDNDRLMRLNRRRMQQQNINDDDDSINNINQRERDELHRVPLERIYGQNIGSNIFGNRRNVESQLNTVDSNNERLLHVGRRRQQLNQDEVSLNENQRTRMLDQDRLINSRFGNMDIDNERLLHINRRRLDDSMDNMTPRRIGRIGEGRRVVDNDDDITSYMRNRFDDEDNMDMLRRNRVFKVPTQQERFMRVLQNDIERMGNTRDSNINDLPTVARDDERLVHINRRRMDQSDSMTPRSRLNYLMPRRVERIGEGRRVLDENVLIGKYNRQDQRVDQFEDEDIMSTLRRNRLVKNPTEQQRFMNVVRGDRRIEGVSNMRDSNINDLPTVARDDERLVHINRRRLDQGMSPMRVQRIGEGRRVLDDEVMSEEQIAKLIRSDNRLTQLSEEEIIELLRQQRLRRQQVNEDGIERGIRSRRSVVNQIEERRPRSSEVLLQNLRQLLARLNQERISMRLGNDEGNNLGLLYPQNQAQRYALRLNEMRMESRRNRQMLEQINQIESRLQQVINQQVRGIDINNGMQLEQQQEVECMIGDVLMGHLGEVGIINILGELLQLDELRLNNPVLLHTLRRIVNIVDQQREQLLGVYRREQLLMSDVSINDVRVSKLRTRIEDFDVELNNMLEQTQQTIVARQQRLNNKPFTIDMDISSQRAQDVIIRVFLGPRQDVNGRDVSLEQRRADFVLLDAVNRQLQSGRNLIQLRSADITWTTRDVTPLREIYRRVMTALRGQSDELVISEMVGETGCFPQRLLLPRGRVEGLPMQLLVIVSPMQRQGRVERRIDGVIGISLASLMDSRPLGFPMDRRIESEQQLLQLSNVQIQDVVIVHDN
ncbi:CG8100 [Drosophila busckii]|uniref:CG8100 n=1 Tax=Drosophila busckii TaxID=30019 RepID=A0A0M4F0B4_DROBS|nr:CG8100 [Drosophila busckii]